MKLERIEPFSYDDSVPPAIGFKVSIRYKRYEEAIVSIDGWLKTIDKKIVAKVQEVFPGQGIRTLDIGAKESSFDVNFKEDTYNTTLIALLDEKTLKYIEDMRAIEKKKKVRFILELNVRAINTKAVVSHVHYMDPEKIGLKKTKITTRSKETSDWYALVWAYDSKYSSHVTNGWLISGDGSPLFLAISEHKLTKEISIDAPDWIYDYAPKLGLGEYFVVEVPKGKGAIQRAWSYVKKAEECFRSWDIKGVFSNCREAGEVLDKVIREKFGKNSFTYNERWGRAYLRFFNYIASLGLHLEEMQGKNWEELIKNLPEGFPHPKRFADYPEDEVKIGRADAEHALFTTKLLVKYAEELLEENS